jgi:hypothetical protein
MRPERFREFNYEMFDALNFRTFMQLPNVLDKRFRSSLKRIAEAQQELYVMSKQPGVPDNLQAFVEEWLLEWKTRGRVVEPIHSKETVYAALIDAVISAR